MKRGVALGLVVALVLALVVGGLAAVLGLGGSSDNSSDPVSGPTASTTTTTRVEFSGADSDAYCAANVRLNQELASNVPASNTPAATEEFYDQRVAVFRELEQIASAEIKPDISVTVAGLDAFRTVLADASWDQSQVSPADIAAIDTPEFTLATQRLAQYDERVCGFAIQG